MNEVKKNAYLLIASVTAAVANGVKHYTPNGGLLTTPASILRALERGGVQIDETDRVARTTTEREYKLLTGEKWR